MRQDLLDEVVWMEIVRMPEEPQLVQIELDRRLQAAQRANPTKRREDHIGVIFFVFARVSNR